ncbi:LOW QUALITY PROTEIN: DUF4371 domain-containing protein, partial [Cephalotus follicularis]
FNLEDIISDPGLRPKNSHYDVNIRDQIRMTYWLKGPCQPRNHTFPFREFGKESRRFVESWFNLHGTWLEYSIAKYATFCLCCYIFKPDHGDQWGGDAFVTEGFTNWRKRERLQVHVGAHVSTHNIVLGKCLALMNENSRIAVALSKQTNEAQIEYRTRLTASVDVIRLFLRQGLPFSGHDESEKSKNQGNFLKFLEFLSNHNESIQMVVLSNVPKNLKLTSPQIQKDIVNAIEAVAERGFYVDGEIVDGLFSILIDESRDVLVKEQMTIVLRYVDDKGCVIERFLAIVHVLDTTASSLKTTIDMLFSTHGLSISRIRGQCYDGASIMQGEFNGFKSLIIKENKAAFYVHCFAHQLQLTLAAVAKNDVQVALLFNLVASLSNIVGASCKRQDILREKESVILTKALGSGEVTSGQGLNQETSLKRARETRWGSHYGALMNLILMFSSAIDVLEIVRTDGSSLELKAEAFAILTFVQTFEFAFNLNLMKTILGMTNELSQALQKKDQNVINAMHLVRVSKQQLQMLRYGGWEDLLKEVSSFCEKNNIEILNMDEKFVSPGRSRNVEETTNFHHFRVEVFHTVIDLQIRELNDRFNEVNTELFICMACLDPSNVISAFDKQKLIRLAKFYPSDFSPVELMVIESQFGTYILDVLYRAELSNVMRIGELAIKLVKLKMDDTYSLVYLLVKLAILLPVATATVERVFSSMKIMKTRLRNRMGDEWMNNSLVAYIERGISNTIDNDTIMKRFQNMKTRR